MKTLMSDPHRRRIVYILAGNPLLQLARLPSSAAGAPCAVLREAPNSLELSPLSHSAFKRSDNRMGLTFSYDR
jgi:hypothetical protein